MKKMLLITAIAAALSACSPANDDMGKVENTFAALDSDNNGYITQSEAQGEAVSQHFAKVDLDGNQQLSEEEFNSFLKANPDAFKDDITQTAQTGSKGDIEPKNTLPENEAMDESSYDSEDMAETDKQMTDEQLMAKAKFDRIDADRSGDLTKAEAMRSGLNEAFSDMDEDNNQVITQEEYIAFYDNRRSTSGSKSE